MELLSNSGESLFERLIPHFRSGLLGKWLWGHLAEN
jgi:hypothetical protein